MITIRQSKDRGQANFGWLDSHHTFSFGHYHDPEHMGFGPLRVINDDRVLAGSGFDTHGHRDMEIISYVLEGAMEHKDSMGNGSVMRPGEVQIMSAGTGVRHSEFNHSKSEDVHFFQIWIMPETDGLTPSYAQKDFSEVRNGKLALVAAGDAREGALKINQNADLYASIVSEGDKLTHTFAPARIGWLQVASGQLLLNGEQLNEGDGAAISDESTVTIEAKSAAEFLLFDMVR